MRSPGGPGPGRRRLALALAAVALGAAAAGCASTAYGPLAHDQGAAARGEALARQACGDCHGLGATGQGRFPGALAFREMRFDYNAISYRRRMADLHAGSVGMPPHELAPTELAEIGAYVRSLQGPRGR